jgi:hypothetical protein
VLVVFTKARHYTNSAFNALDHYGKFCLDCHKHKSTPPTVLTFAFQPTGGCDACHGYPPVRSMTVAGIGQLGFSGRYSTAKLQNYSGGGGAHAVKGHLPLTTIRDQGVGGCTTCHNDQSGHNTGQGTVRAINVKVTVDPQFKFNNSLPITYSGVPATGQQGTCSNVSCHYQKSPNWATKQ